MVFCRSNRMTYADDKGLLLILHLNNILFYLTRRYEGSFLIKFFSALSVPAISYSIFCTIMMTYIIHSIETFGSFIFDFPSIILSRKVDQFADIVN